MKILIENEETREYLTNKGGWSKNPSEGKVFPAATPAFRAAKQEAVAKFAIVLHIPETNQFVNLNHGHGTGVPSAA